MNTTVQMTRFFSLNHFRLFDYLSKARLIEKWAWPEGMSLKIPLFEEKMGGQYRYEHTSEQGVFVCTGVVKEFSPGKRLVQLDHEIIGPDGKKLHSDIECVLDLKEIEGGTEVSLTVNGFKDEKASKECHEGWKECFDHLEHLLVSDKNEMMDDDFSGTQSNISI